MKFKRMLCICLVVFIPVICGGCAKSPWLNPWAEVRVEYIDCFYKVKDENSAELIRFLNKLEYDDEICLCSGDVTVRVEGKSLGLMPEEYARWGEKQHNFTEEESAKVKKLLEKIITSNEAREK